MFLILIFVFLFINILSVGLFTRLVLIVSDIIILIMLKNSMSIIFELKKIYHLFRKLCWKRKIETYTYIHIFKILIRS